MSESWRYFLSISSCDDYCLQRLHSTRSKFHHVKVLVAQASQIQLLMLKADIQFLITRRLDRSLSWDEWIQRPCVILWAAVGPQTGVQLFEAVCDCLLIFAGARLIFGGQLLQPQPKYALCVIFTYFYPNQWCGTCKCLYFNRWPWTVA